MIRSWPLRSICLWEKFKTTTKMDQSKETKTGIFYTLKKRFWTSKVGLTSKSCFKSRSSNHKQRSESSHCNFISSTNVVFRPTETYSDANTSSPKELSSNNPFSASEPSIANCIVEPYEIVQTSSNIETKNDSSSLQACIITNNLQEDVQSPDTSDRNLKFLSSAYLDNSHASTSSHPTLAKAVVENEEYSKIEEIVGDNVVPDPKSGLMCELLKLSKHGWYWGSITKEEAEEKLTDQPDGAFLLRDSSADHFILSLSFRSSGKTLHTRIEYSLGKGQFSFYQQAEETFSSIAELVEHSMSFSQSAVYCYSRPRSPGHPSFPVRLTKPISRFAHVWSLQHLCRFVIRESIRLDNIQKLPLPNKIKGYIEEGHY